MFLLLFVLLLLFLLSLMSRGVILFMILSISFFQQIFFHTLFLFRQIFLLLRYLTQKNFLSLHPSFIHLLFSLRTNLIHLIYLDLKRDSYSSEQSQRCLFHLHSQLWSDIYACGISYWTRSSIRIFHIHIWVFPVGLVIFASSLVSLVLEFILRKNILRAISNNVCWRMVFGNRNIWIVVFPFFPFLPFLRRVPFPII